MLLATENRWLHRNGIAFTVSLSITKRWRDKFTQMVSIMNETLYVILISIIGMSVILYLISLINYRVDDRYVRCLFGPIPIRKLVIEDICDVKREYRHMSESWTNTIWMPTIRKRGVTIYRRTGGFKRVVVTPDDPDTFIRSIKNHSRFIPTN